MKGWLLAALVGSIGGLAFAQDPTDSEQPPAVEPNPSPAPIAAPDPARVTPETIQGFFTALAELQDAGTDNNASVDEGQAEPDREFDVAKEVAQFSTAVASAPPERRERVDAVARSHGFTDGEAWAAAGDRILAISLWKACRAAPEDQQAEAAKVLNQLEAFKFDPAELAVVEANEAAAEFISDISCPA